MQNSVDRCERTVFVSEMHPTVTEEVLYDLFKQCGLIEKVILKEEPSGTPQHALIIYKNPQSVMRAIDTLTGTTFNGQTINIRPLRESSYAVGLEAGGETADTGKGYGSSSNATQHTVAHAYGPLGASMFPMAMSQGSGLLPSQTYGSPMGLMPQYNPMWANRYSMTQPTHYYYK